MYSTRLCRDRCLLGYRYMHKTLSSRLHVLALAAFFAPVTVLAQTTETTSKAGFEKVGTFLLKFVLLIDNVLVPIIFALAFLVFLWGIYQYFIQGGASEENREKGRSLMIWGFIGFFVMVSVWGIVNLLVGSLSLDNSTHPTLPTFGTSNSSGATTNSGAFPAAQQDLCANVVCGAGKTCSPSNGLCQ